MNLWQVWGAMRASIKLATDFDRSMNQIQALCADQAEANQWRAQVYWLMREGYSPDRAAEHVYQRLIRGQR